MRVYHQYSGYVSPDGHRSIASIQAQLARDRRGSGMAIVTVELIREEAEAQCHRLRIMIDACRK